MARESLLLVLLRIWLQLSFRDVINDHVEVELVHGVSKKKLDGMERHCELSGPLSAPLSLLEERAAVLSELPVHCAAMFLMPP